MAIFEHLKGLARHSAIYTVSTFVQRALGFVLLPIYTSVEYIPSRSDYGDFTLVYTFIAFMTIVYLYGMDAAIMRYFFLGRFKRRDVYSTAFTGVLVNALFLSVVIFLSAPYVANFLLGETTLQRFIKIAAGILLLDSLGNLPYHLLRAEERSVVYSSVRVGRFLLELILNIVFVVGLRMGVEGILWANLSASAVNFVALLPIQLTYLGGNLRKETFKELTAFGLPLLPNGLAYLTVEVSDKFLMRLLLDKDAVGVYAPNYKFGSLLLLVVMAFRTAWQPFFLKLARQTNAKIIYAHVMTYASLIGAILIMLGTLFIEYIVKIPLPKGKTIMGQAYWEGNFIIPIILTAYWFYGMYVNFTVGIYIEKKTRYMILFTGLAAVVNVGSNLYLMPHYGILGAALATLLSYLVMAVSIFIANQRIYPIPYQFGRLGLLILYVAIILALYYSVALHWTVRIAIVFISPLFFYLGGFFKINELKILWQRITKGCVD